MRGRGIKKGQKYNRLCYIVALSVKVRQLMSTAGEDTDINHILAALPSQNVQVEATPLDLEPSKAPADIFRSINV